MPLLRLLPAALLACLLVLAAPAAAAPKCKPEQPAFKTRSGIVCGKASAPKAGVSRETLALSAWIRSVTGPTRGKRLPKRLRRALPHLTRLAGEVMAPPAKPRARAAAAGAVLERTTIDGGSEVHNGVKVTAQAELRRHEGGDQSVALEMKMSYKDLSLRFRPQLDVIDFGAMKLCPTAAGSLYRKQAFAFGGTYISAKAGRVLDAKTTRGTMELEARGRVGRDARLEHVDSDVKLGIGIYKRGWNQEWSVSGGFAAEREGGATVRRPTTADYRIRVAGASASEEREYEQAAARHLAAAPEITEILRQGAPLARKSLLDGEAHWYELPNDCARMELDPAEARLAPGESLPVQGSVIASNGGGEAEGTFAVESVDPGRFGVTRADADPGAPGLFTAVAGEPDASDWTVGARAIATSRAGRAQGSWVATYERPEFPEAFVGAAAAKTNVAGARHEWRGTGTWTRQSVESYPDGSKTAWYELTEAELSFAESHLGEGCHWAAKGTGGKVESGDVELRILPDGRRVYALMYDVGLPVTYRAEGCPPGAELPPIDGTIPAMLNSRIPGPADQVFRPAGEGWRLEATQVTDVPQPPFGSTVGTWTLEPAA